MTLISSYSTDNFYKKYQFAYTDPTKAPPDTLKDGLLTPSPTVVGDLSSKSLDDYNSELQDIEENDSKTSVLLDTNSNPKDVRELLRKVAGGKYLTFIKQHTDGIVMGRNLGAEDSNGDYVENQGAAASAAVSQDMTDGDKKKLIMIDTYNSAFNSVGSKTLADKKFTKYSEAIAVFANEIQQAYYQSKNNDKQDAKALSFVQGALTDLQTYASNNAISFVPPTYKSIFNTAVSSMISNVGSTITSLNAGSSTHKSVPYSSFTTSA